MEATQEKSATWLDRPLLTTVTLNWETVLFGLIVVLFVITRFFDLGARVMSHDESLHTYYSWLLSRGQGFTHTPLMHGPLQFHLIALSYFLFGDSDFTARIPAVLGSIASVVLLWQYRRYLGRPATIIAAVMFLISPYLLYYGRYVRNEALIVPLGLATLWSMLRYKETGQKRYLYYLTTATVLHFTAKETAFIYTAQALLFLALYFINRVTQQAWPNPDHRRNFILALMVALILAGVGGGAGLFGQRLGTLNAAQTAAPSVPGDEAALTPVGVPSTFTLVLIIFATLALVVAAVFLVRGFTLQKIRAERSFDLLILLGTLVLPQLAPFPVEFLGWDSLDYSFEGMLRTSRILVPMILISMGVGLWWNMREWLINAAIFLAIFTVFYTTIFTNGGGFFTGLVGSLGYWLEQQGVRRGSQPWYYYLLLQVPFYEYLPVLGSITAVVLWIRRRLMRDPESSQQPEPETDSPSAGIPTFGLLVFWVVTSALAYTIAGEKMPWLTVHIAWPMILLSAWGLGRLVEAVDWTAFREKRGPLLIAVLAVFLTSLTAVLSSLLGTKPPFQGSELPQLQATSTFLMALVTAAGSGWGLALLLRAWEVAQFTRVAVLTIFGFLGLLTARSAFLATYINYDNATEYLVYAHGARGVKDVMDQVLDISRRTTDGLALRVAYDDDVSWPFTWYLRNYTNQHYYAKSPTRELRDLPVVLVGDDNFGTVEPILGQAFHKFDYIRMWWPDQDYFNLTWERMRQAIANPEMRAALFQIWLNRDYTKYTELVNKDLSLPNWSPSDRMRMYVRKDVATQLWNYGVGPAPDEVVADPYEGRQIELSADLVLGGEGVEAGQFASPRGVAVSTDGSLYVADSRNHRIQHLGADGAPLHVWGSFADLAAGPAPGGTFNEPWGIALGPDGSVYVADTWNHRVQKFSPEGQFLTMWGYFGTAEDPFAFWGPRDVAVDDQGRVLVTDTGNKRIVVFDADGNFISEIGGAGFATGQFDEPTGVTFGAPGFFFVADTWNQRIQSFSLGETGAITPITFWELNAWFGQSLDNKPYITSDGAGRLFVSDPEGFRILEFNDRGEFQRYWGDFGSDVDGLNLPTGLGADGLGGIWVSDSGNHRLLHFTLPVE